MDAKSSYFSISDNEDMEIDEPYSEEYHRKMAILQSKSDSNDSVSNESDSLSMLTNSAIKSDRPIDSIPQIKIVSVCSLTDSPSFDDEISTSVAEAADAHDTRTSNNVRGLLESANNKVFGIASAIAHSTEKEMVDSDDDHVEVKRRGRGRPRNQHKTSKIGSLRKTLDVAYRAAGIKIEPLPEKRSKRISERRMTLLSKQERIEEKVQAISNQESDIEIEVDDMQVSLDKTSAQKLSRRKPIHKPIFDDANDIEFVIDDDEEQTQLPVSPISTTSVLNSDNYDLHLPVSPVVSPRTEMLDASMKIVREVPNENADLLKKVAFLRCCVNYMMKELGRKPYHFPRYVNINYLKSRYFQNQMC